MRAEKPVWFKDYISCPKCLSELRLEEGIPICKKDGSHRFDLIHGIPSFVKPGDVQPEDERWVFDYDESAEDYDEPIKQYDRWLGVDLQRETSEMLKPLPLSSAERLLDVSTGTGRIIREFIRQFPDIECDYVGVDLSIGMLKVAERKFREMGLKVPLYHAQVDELLFEDSSFDIVTHAGGINTFSDIPAALEEWVRVLRPGGTMMVSDEGLSPSVRKTQRGIRIIRDNRLFGSTPPLGYMPPQLKDINLRWFARDTFYVITGKKLTEDELGELEIPDNEQKNSRNFTWDTKGRSRGQ